MRSLPRQARHGGTTVVVYTHNHSYMRMLMKTPRWNGCRENRCCSTARTRVLLPASSYAATLVCWAGRFWASDALPAVRYSNMASSISVLISCATANHCCSNDSVALVPLRVYANTQRWLRWSQHRPTRARWKPHARCVQTRTRRSAQRRLSVTCSSVEASPRNVIH